MKVKQNLKRLLLTIIVCLPFGYFNPSINAQQTPSYNGTGVFDKPVAVKFTGLGNTVTVGEAITLGVDLARNGCTIDDSTWYIGTTKVTSFPYPIKNTDHGKKITVVVKYNTTEETTIEYQNITLGGTYTAKSNQNIPVGENLEIDFPITYNDGNIVADPLPGSYDYKGTNKTYFLTQDPIYEFVTTKTIVYKNTSYECDVVYSASRNITYPTAGVTEPVIAADIPKAILAVNNTIFLDKGVYWPINGTGYGTFSFEGLKIIGTYSPTDATPSIIGPNHVYATTSLQGHATYIIQKNQVFENVVFDGAKMRFYGNGTTSATKNYYYFFTLNQSSANLIMKNIVFRDIGNGTNCRSVLNFVAVDDSWREGINLAPMCFWNVTIESATTSSAYDLININGRNSLSFKNLNIKTTSGYASIGLTNNGSATASSGSTTYGCKDIIFDGLTLPSDKGLSILRYSSRNVSLPKEYRYLQMNTNWSLGSTSTSSSAIQVFKNLPEDFPVSIIGNLLKYTFYDAIDGSYIISNNFTNVDKATVEYQLGQLNDLLKSGNTASGTYGGTLPQAKAIKFVAKSTRTGNNTEYTIDPFTIPDLSNISAVHIAAVKNASDSFEEKSDMIKYKGNPSSKILLNSNVVSKVKLYNIDFTDENYSTIYHATGVLNTDTESNSIYVASSSYNETNLSTNTFYNCLFKNFTTTPLAINGDAVVTLGSTNICEGDLSAALPIDITGIDYDKEWNIKYRVKGSSDTPTPLTITTGSGTITLDSAPTSSPIYYELTSTVGPGGKQAFITGDGAVTTNPIPIVNPITGVSSVTTVSTETLSSTTPSGTWSSSNTGVATIDAGTGVVTGISTGTTEITYTVIDNGCSATVNHQLTVTSSSTPPTPPTPEPKPEEPTPNPDAPGLVLQDIAPFCYEDREFRIPFEITSTTVSVIEYRVIFDDKAIAAGLKSITDYKELTPNYITVPVSNRVETGIYQGTIEVRFVDKPTIIEKYKFTLEVLGYVQITVQPVSAYSYCGYDPFLLTVEATGDNLTYQWFHNGEEIKGAVSDTYTQNMSAETEGKYYVEVYGSCGWEVSDTVDVRMSGISILMKWDDVLYVKNTDNRYIKFQWYKDGQAITTHGTSVYYTDPQGLRGTYFVRAYYSETEYDESCPVTFTTKTRSSGVSVYPNPVASNTVLTIESDEIGETYIGGRAELYNIGGTRLFTINIHSSAQQIPINYPAGYYILRIIHPSGKTTVEKMIVK